MLDKLSDGQRTFIAVGLSISILFGWQFLFPPPKKPPRAVTNTESVMPPGATSAASATMPNAAPAGSPPISIPSAASTPVATPVASAASVGTEAVVETDLFRAVFSSVDGGLESYQLKRYQQGLEADSQPIEIVHIAGAEARPLRVDVIGRAEGNRATAVTFDQERIDLAGGDYRTATLTQTAEVEPGLQLVKTLTFSPSSYLIDIEARLEAASDRSFNYGLVAYWVQSEPPSGEEDRYSFVGPEVFVDGTLEQIKPDKIEGVREFITDVFWLGYGDKYFLGALVPPIEDRKLVRGQVARSAAGNVYTSLLYPPAPLGAGESRTYRWQAFIGPKEIDTLKEAGNGLQYSLDYGWFGVISRPMVYALKFFHGLTSNWGIAIILLTIVVKILFFPLTQKSYTSMKAMQKLQPHMKRLKEQHKDDKEELNKQLMDLYRRHKVNPFAGCLPILLQIPVFFGLYRALLNSIELRHAPFGFWIQDLAAKDPYYITPIIMGATMFLQQKMTPTTMDPAQARIMQFMPIIFTAMFLQFPSGLVIYWLVNNVLSIGQQYLINRKPETATA